MDDVRSDPWEQYNIYGTPLAPDTGNVERELLEWTEASLALMDEYGARGEAREVPPELRDRLRDTGYVQ